MRITPWTVNTRTGIGRKTLTRALCARQRAEGGTHAGLAL